MTRLALMVVAAVVALKLPPPFEYQGHLLYPYYCTKTWVCDYVTEEVWRNHCQKRPCTERK